MILHLILATFAVYRLAYLIVAEIGPFSLAVRFRSFFVNRFGQTHWLSEGVMCIYCVSFWLSFVVALLLPWPGWQIYVLNSLAIGTGVMLVHKVHLWG